MKFVNCALSISRIIAFYEHAHFLFIKKNYTSPLHKKSNHSYQPLKNLVFGKNRDPCEKLMDPWRSLVSEVQSLIFLIIIKRCPNWASFWSSLYTNRGRCEIETLDNRAWGQRGFQAWLYLTVNRSFYYWTMNIKVTELDSNSYVIDKDL